MDGVVRSENIPSMGEEKKKEIYRWSVGTSSNPRFNTACWTAFEGSRLLRARDYSEAERMFETACEEIACDRLKVPSFEECDALRNRCVLSIRKVKTVEAIRSRNWELALSLATRLESEERLRPDPKLPLVGKMLLATARAGFIGDDESITSAIRLGSPFRNMFSRGASPKNA